MDQNSNYRSKLSSSFFLFVCISLLIMLCSPHISAQQNYKQIAVSLVQQYAANDQMKQLRGATVAVISFKMLDDDENFNPRTLQGWITNEFVNAKLMKVVARTDIDEALKELKIQDSGLVARENQQRLGNFLAAEYLLLGTISRNKTTYSVTSTLQKVENGEIVAVAAFGDDGPLHVAGGGDDNPPPTPVSLQAWDSNEFLVLTEADSEKAARIGVLAWLVEKQIFGSANDVYERWAPEIYQNIYATPDIFITEVIGRQEGYYIKINFTQVIRELIFMVFGKITPRISVDTIETIINRPVPDPAVQTELESALLRYGFQIVDSTQAKRALIREALRQLNSGDEKAAILLQNNMSDIGADIAFIGESFAEERQNRDGFDARVEFKMVDQISARIFTSIAGTYALRAKDEPKLDPTSNVFAKLVLQKCANQNVVRMASEILCSYGQPIYRIRVWKIANFDNRTLIVNHLKDKLPGATVVAREMDLRGSNSLVIEIMTKKSADTIAEVMQTVPGQRVRVTDIACRSIVCEMK